MPIRHGHAPSHYRETFGNAVDAWFKWAPGEPEPMVEHEVNYEPRLMPLSAACRLLWNCSDILPGDCAWRLKDAGLPLRRHTYGAAAQAILASMRGGSVAA